MISVRRLDTLVRGLPLESLTLRELGAYVPGHPIAPSGAELLELDLLAIVADRVAAANYYFTKANSKKGSIITEPTWIPRVWRDTGEDEGSKEQSSPAEMANFFGSRVKIRYTPKEEVDDGR